MTPDVHHHGSPSSCSLCHIASRSVAPSRSCQVFLYSSATLLVYAYCRDTRIRMTRTPRSTAIASRIRADPRITVESVVVDEPPTRACQIKGNLKDFHIHRTLIVQGLYGSGVSASGISAATAKYPDTRNVACKHQYADSASAAVPYSAALPSAGSRARRIVPRRSLSPRFCPVA